jgi:hypothetical protein
MRRPLAVQALATPKLLGNEDRRVTTDFGRLTSSIPSPSAPVGGPVRREHIARSTISE